MLQSGKCLLFDLTEFDAWLSGLTVSRKIKVIQNNHRWLPDYQTFDRSKDQKGEILLYGG